MCKTPKQVRKEFNRAGLSISEWARKHRVKRSLVVYVLDGGVARRGQAHDIAVLLGVKEGVVRADSRLAA